MYKILLVLFLFVLGCDDSNSDSRSKGYDDGLRAGYNYLCEGGGTRIAADWNNKYYSEGYAEGYEIGAGECYDERFRDYEQNIYELEVQIEELNKTIIELKE